MRLVYWTSDDCDGQAILTLHLSVGQVILFPYFDHWTECELAKMEVTVSSKRGREVEL